MAMIFRAELARPGLQFLDSNAFTDEERQLLRLSAGGVVERYS